MFASALIARHSVDVMRTPASSPVARVLVPARIELRAAA
jgi:hypothetical protein